MELVACALVPLHPKSKPLRQRQASIFVEPRARPVVPHRNGRSAAICPAPEHRQCGATRTWRCLRNETTQSHGEVSNEEGAKEAGPGVAGPGTDTSVAP